MFQLPVDNNVKKPARTEMGGEGVERKREREREREREGGGGCSLESGSFAHILC